MAPTARLPRPSSSSVIRRRTLVSGGGHAAEHRVQFFRMKSRTTFRGVVLRRPSANPRVVAPVARPEAVRVARQVAGRGGKSVSVISGLPLSAPELEQLATRLKKLCGAGGAVKEGNIEIQGEHRDRLVAELHKLGFPAKRAGG